MGRGEPRRYETMCRGRSGVVSNKNTTTGILIISAAYGYSAAEGAIQKQNRTAKFATHAPETIDLEVGYTRQHEKTLAKQTLAT